MKDNETANVVTNTGQSWLSACPRRLCFVVQRYGLEVNGGAELLCRQLAEKVSQHCEVHVFTTKAIDYVTWRNEYTEDIECINDVTIHRFPVKRERNIKRFNILNALLVRGKLPRACEKLWVEEQGPYAPALIQAVADNAGEYDAFVFNTYLYYPSVMGIPQVAEKAIFIPDAHDEPYLHFDCMRNEFESAAGFFFNTEEERRLAKSLFDIESTPSDIGGVGVEVPPHAAPDQFRNRFGIEGPYIIYVGRIDESKGCKEMFGYWEEYKRRHPEQLTLVLLGKSVMIIPERDDIRPLGFVSDEDKFSGIEGSVFLLLPSKFESLSIVVLEALSLGVPVLVNGKSDVLHGHCVRSGAGLYYNNYEEFEATTTWMLSGGDEVGAMRSSGPNYVRENYQWDIIVGKLFDLISHAIPE